MSLAMVAAGVSITAGVNSLSGGSLFGGAPTQIPSGQADPWGTSGGRAQAGTMLQNLMNNPAQAMSMPGFQGMQTNTVNTANANNAAVSGGAGAFAPGGAQQTLNNQIQANTMNAFGQYEGILANLAGVPNAQQGVNAAGQNANVQNTGMGNVMQGMGALNASLGGSGSNYSGNYISPGDLSIQSNIAASNIASGAAGI